MKPRDFGFRTSRPDASAPPSGAASGRPSLAAARFAIRHGFTIIEILIVIIIILLMLGVAVGIGQWTMRQGEEAMTKTALKNAELLYYEVTVRGIPLSPPGNTTAHVVAAARGAAPTRDLLTRFPKEVYKSNTLYDGWSRPLMFVPPGTGGAKNAYFYSVGPDGINGNADDIYSQDANR